MQVRVKHRLTGKTRFTLRGFTEKPCSAATFTSRADNSELSVLTYFKKQYPGYPLRYANLPCAVMGSESRPDWVPIECCQVIPGPGAV